MSTQTAARHKRISIHDYPQHLNPFSDTHHSFDSYEKGRIFVDKLRRRSSKITHHLSRSVSWFERPRSSTDESIRTCENIRDDDRRSVNNCVSAGTNVNDENAPQRTIRASPTAIAETKTCDNAKDEIKPEVRRRKKRPAPLPPVSNAVVDTVTTQKQQISCNSAVVDVEHEKNDTEDVKITHQMADKLIEMMDEITRVTTTNDAKVEGVTTKTDATISNVPASETENTAITTAVDCETRNASSTSVDCETDDASITTAADDLQETLIVEDECCDENRILSDCDDCKPDDDCSRLDNDDDDAENENATETAPRICDELKSCNTVADEVVECTERIPQNISVSSSESEVHEHSLTKTYYNGEAVMV